MKKKVTFGAQYKENQSKNNSIHSILLDSKTKFKIYLSNLLPADLLNSFQINSLVSLTPSDILPYYPVSTLKIKLQDHHKQNILQHFQSVNQYIQAEINRSNVLIQCQTGVTLAPSFAIAFIMKRYKYSLYQAYNLVKNKIDNVLFPNQIRPCNQYIIQLKAYEEQLQIKQKMNVKEQLNKSESNSKQLQRYALKNGVKSSEKKVRLGSGYLSNCNSQTSIKLRNISYSGINKLKKQDLKQKLKNFKKIQY